MICVFNLKGTLLMIICVSEMHIAFLMKYGSSAFWANFLVNKTPFKVFKICWFFKVFWNILDPLCYFTFNAWCSFFLYSESKSLICISKSFKQRLMNHISLLLACKLRSSLTRSLKIWVEDLGYQIQVNDLLIFIESHQSFLLPLKVSPASFVYSNPKL